MKLLLASAKEKFSTNASTSQIETSNDRDEENGAQARVPPLSPRVAGQHSDVPACRAAQTVLLQSLSEARSPEPRTSLLLRRTAAASGRHIRRSQAARSIHRCSDSLAEQRSCALPLVARHTVNSIVAAPASHNPSNLIPLLPVRALQRSPNAVRRPCCLHEKESPCPKGWQPRCFRSFYWLRLPSMRRPNTPPCPTCLVWICNPCRCRCSRTPPQPR
jgi:hypothetical protein